MRPANIIRPSKLTTTLPEDLRAKLDLHLWSELEQRVPVGAYQRFLVERIVEYFNSTSLDIGEYLGLPTSAWVRGTPAAIELLRNKLEKGP